MRIMRRDEDGNERVVFECSILGIVCLVWVAGFAADTLLDVVERVKHLDD